MHAAKASAIRAALLDLQITPRPDTHVFRQSVSSIPRNFECISIFRYESILAFSHQNGQDVSRFDSKPFPYLSLSREIDMELPFKC